MLPNWLICISTSRIASTILPRGTSRKGTLTPFASLAGFISLPEASNLGTGGAVSSPSIEVMLTKPPSRPGTAALVPSAVSIASSEAHT